MLQSKEFEFTRGRGLLLALLAAALLGGLLLYRSKRPGVLASPPEAPADAGEPAAEGAVPELLAAESDITVDAGPEGVELEEVRTESERAAVAPVLLAGEVTSSGELEVGMPSASWLTLEEIDPRTQQPWWLGALWREAPRVESDVSGLERAGDVGRYSFTDAPAGGASGSFVLVTAQDHLACAAPVTQGAVSEEAVADGSSGPDLALEPTRAVEVLVIDGAGEPIPAARVASVGWLRAGGARRVSLQYSTDDTGRAGVCPLPGESVLCARTAEGQSALWRGNHDQLEGPVTLTVGPSFSARGMVLGVPDPAALEGAVVMARKEEKGRRWNQFEDAWSNALATGAVEPDGSWSMPDLPWVGAGTYVLRLQGAGTTPFEVSREFDSPTEWSADLEWSGGKEIGFQIEDTSGKRIEDALVVAAWSSDQSSWMRYSMRTDSDGQVLFDACPQENLWLRITAEGYALKAYGPVQVPTLIEYNHFVIQINRVGTVTGRCTFEGQPVHDFEVAYWGADPRDRAVELFEDREDGSFELQHAPAGEVHLYALAQGLAPSEIESLEARPPDSPVDSEPPASGVTAAAVLELELQGTTAVHGKVIEAASGQPIAGVQVRVETATAARRIDPWGQPVYTGSAGTFRGLPLGASRSAIVFTAAGYSDHVQYLSGPPHAEGDLGTIALQGQESVTLRLNGGDSTRYGEFQGLSLESGVPRRFSPEGVLTLEGLRVGDTHISVHPPHDVNRIDFSCKVVAGQDNEYVVELGPREPCQVQLVPEDEIEGFIFLAAEFVDPGGRQFTWIRIFDEELRTEVALPANTPVMLNVLDTAAIKYATTWEVTGPRGGDVFKIPIGSEEDHLLFVDQEEQPLQNVQIFIAAAGGDAPCWTWMETDRNGYLVLRNFQGPKALVYVRPGSAQSFSGLREVELVESSADEPIVVTMDATQRLNALFVERGKPAVNLAISLITEGLAYATLDRSTGPDGAALFAAISPGEYKLSVDTGGYWHESFGVQVPHAGEQLEFEVRRIGSATLYLTREGLPASGLAVELECVERGEAVAAWVEDSRVSTGAAGLVSATDGSVGLEGLPNGPYRLRVSLPGGALHEQLFNVPPHDLVEVQVVLP